MRTISAGPARSPTCATFPLMVAWPAEISSSISRREPNPACASNLCNFCVAAGAERELTPAAIFAEAALVPGDPCARDTGPDDAMDNRGDCRWAGGLEDF